ncbi:hypothetical protein D9M73_232390 [compost metagenome]
MSRFIWPGTGRKWPAMHKRHSKRICSRRLPDYVVVYAVTIPDTVMQKCTDNLHLSGLYKANLH